MERKTLSEMIERVAKELARIDEQDGAAPWGHPSCDINSYRQRARAAIAAMREPTEAMLSTVIPRPDYWPPAGQNAVKDAIITKDRRDRGAHWTAMIEAAIAHTGARSPLAKREPGSNLWLVEIGKSSPPVLAVIDAPGDMSFEEAEYFVEVKLCPHDILNMGVAEILQDGDTDPHGVISLIQQVPRPDDWPFTGTVNWGRFRDLFDQLDRDPHCLEAPRKHGS